jgi:hypothetical protein
VGWDKSALGWAKFRGIGQVCFGLGSAEFWSYKLVVASVKKAINQSF